MSLTDILAIEAQVVTYGVSYRFFTMINNGLASYIEYGIHLCK